MSPPALHATGLVKDYRRGRAVDGVDLTGGPGERVALLGPNGAGTPTTLLMCLGAVPPDAGWVEILRHRLPPGRGRAMARVALRAGLREMSDEEGTALQITSHNMVEVGRLCERVVFLSGGRVVANGSPGQITERFGRDDLEGVFLHLAEVRDEEGALR